MGETINLFERDPRKQLLQHVDSLFELVDSLDGLSQNDAVHPATLEEQDTRQALLKAIISDQLSKRVFQHNNQADTYSISHDTYLNIAGRIVYVSGVDKLPGDAGYKLPLDFEDTAMDAVGMLYVTRDEMPYMVEFAEGETFDPLQEQEHRRRYLSAEDSRTFSEGIELIKADLQSQQPFDD